MQKNGPTPVKSDSCNSTRDSGPVQKRKRKKKNQKRRKAGANSDASVSNFSQSERVKVTGPKTPIAKITEVPWTQVLGRRKRQARTCSPPQICSLPERRADTMVPDPAAIWTRDTVPTPSSTADSTGYKAAKKVKQKLKEFINLAKEDGLTITNWSRVRVSAVRIEPSDYRMAEFLVSRINKITLLEAYIQQPMLRRIVFKREGCNAIHFKNEKCAVFLEHPMNKY